MLLIILRRLTFMWICFWRMLILYMTDGGSFIFADYNILIISRGSIGSMVAVNGINNAIFFSKITEDVPTQSI